MPTWIRRLSASVLAMTFVGSVALGKQAEAKPQNKAFPIDAGKVLVSKAAAMSMKDWKSVGTSQTPPKPSDFANQPLTVLMLSLPILIDNTPEMNQEFGLIGGQGKPVDLGHALYPGIGVKNPQSPSMLHPEYITALKADASGDRVEGTVEFTAPKTFRGKVRFSGRKVGGQWWVTEFRLPAHGKKTTLGPDGNWKIADIRSPKKPQDTAGKKAP